jgi:hypothetical protein
MMEISTTSNDEIIVKFTGHLRPFQLIQRYCNNPDCPCNQVSLEFIEVEKDGSAVPNQIRFSFGLDLGTWQVCEDTKDIKQTNALVDEFLHDLSDEMKAMFQKKRETIKQRNRKLANFTMPVEDIKCGRLISFSEIMSDRKGDYDGFPAYGFQFAHEGQTYLIDDLYCPNPKCKCNEVHLMFLNYSKRTGETATATEIFLAELSFDGKKREFPELVKFSESQAEELVRLWLHTEPDILDDLKQRYKEVKKITKRILKNNRKSPSSRIQAIPSPSKAIPIINSDTGFTKDFKLGRNTPCPCGSGKKYKKCCGRIQKVGASG